VPFINRALAALKRVAIVIGIAIAFSIGLIGALILSLSSSQTRVPDIVGRDRAAAEDAISAARLNFRVRATRPAGGAKPNTVLIQIPSAGEEVKVGQTVAVDLSRPAKEGESSATATSSPEDEEKPGKANERVSANSNENKPKRNKNTNKALNDNQNSNANRNQNANTNANSNRNGNQNLSPAKTPANTSVNSDNRRKGVNVNRGNGNSSTNRRRPIGTPTPN
jgi:beta-lactam-binding protein with PASTA domain